MRLLLLRHARWTGVLAVLALCMTILAPAGFMPVMIDGAITIQLCPGKTAAAAPGAMPGTVMPDHDGDHGGSPRPHQTSDTPCAFSGVFSPSTGAIDPVMFAVATAAVLALAFRLAERPPAAAEPRLRPPSRAPPTTA